MRRALLVLSLAAISACSDDKGASSPSSEIPKAVADETVSPTVAAETDVSTTPSETASKPAPVKPKEPEKTALPQSEIAALTKSLLVEHYQTGDLAKIEKWLQAGADPNGYVEGRGPALSYAVSYTGKTGIELLFKYGAKPNYSTGRGDTPLKEIYSKFEKSPEDMIGVLDLFLENGLDLRNESLSEVMNQAAWDGSLGMVKWLVGHKFVDVDVKRMAQRRVQGDDPLAEAINKIDDVLDLRTAGATPLMNASKMARVEVVKYLLEQKADPNAVDGMGRTPLMLLFSVSHSFGYEHEAVEVWRLLLKAGAKLDMKDKKGNTMIHHSINSWKEPHFTHYMLLNGFTGLETNHKGETALDVIRFWKAKSEKADQEPDEQWRYLEKLVLAKGKIERQPLKMKPNQDSEGNIRCNTEGGIYPYDYELIEGKGELSPYGEYKWKGKEKTATIRVRDFFGEETTAKVKR